MDRVFLDANVLFSAAYIPRCRITRLWRLKGVRLLTSRFVAEEAIRNIEIKRPDRLRALVRLLKHCQMVDEVSARLTPPAVELPAKDKPVLAGAMAGDANYLLTGDKHFRPLFGRVVGRVTIMRPGDYLHLRGE